MYIANRIFYKSANYKIRWETYFKERILSHTEKLYFYVMIIYGLEKRYYEKFFTTELTEHTEKKIELV